MTLTAEPSHAIAFVAFRGHGSPSLPAQVSLEALRALPDALGRLHYWVRSMNRDLAQPEEGEWSTVAEQIDRHWDVLTTPCAHCGEQLDFEAVGHHGMQTTTACQFPKGPPSYALTIDVPSGVLAVGTDFSEALPWLGGLPENETRWAREREQAQTLAADHQLMRVYVGRNSVAVYGQGEDRFCVRDGAGRGQWLGDVEEDPWYVSVMDEALYVTACAKRGVEPQAQRLRLMVPPGRYRCRLGPYPKGQRAQAQTYFSFRRVGPCVALAPAARPTDLAHSGWVRALERERRHRRPRTHVAGWVSRVLLQPMPEVPMGWVDGAQPSLPVDRVEGQVDGPGLMDQWSVVPVVPLGEALRGEALPRLSWDAQTPSTLMALPADVSVHWLALALVWTKSLLAAPACLGRVPGAWPATQDCAEPPQLDEIAQGQDVAGLQRAREVLMAQATDRWPAVQEALAALHASPWWLAFQAPRLRTSLEQQRDRRLERSQQATGCARPESVQAILDVLRTHPR